ncbi:UNVERIFIED_CONTAM: hypothetical protein GTU68_005174 [Idotea baltica]|nr:hypothetical protein [Idotea baltica]
MCGRIVVKDVGEDIFEVADLSKVGKLTARYNIAPSQKTPVLRKSEQGVELIELQWGLIPHWVKDLSKTKPQINARSETAAEKPFFRDSFKKSRCLIPVNGFYEWKKEGDKKQPYYISLESDKVFCFAGLCSKWSGGEESRETFAILTCEPNDVMKPIHNRMPVILSKDNYKLWLEGNREEVTKLLVPAENAGMTAFPVSTYVNSPRNQGLKCIERLS